MGETTDTNGSAPSPSAQSTACAAAREYLVDTLAGIRAHTRRVTEEGLSRPAAAAGTLTEQHDWGLDAMKVSGDGNCLAHSISRALFGVEAFYAVLRRGLEDELLANRDWYMAALADTETAENFEKEVAKAGDSGTLGMSGLAGVEWLEAGTGLHLLGFANLLRRPLILMGARRHIGSAKSGCLTYLPIRHKPSELATTVPIVVAWGNEGGPTTGAGHFVCLVPTAGSPEAVIPQQLCPPLHASCAAFLASGPCELGEYLRLAPAGAAREAPTGADPAMAAFAVQLEQMGYRREARRALVEIGARPTDDTVSVVRVAIEYISGHEGEPDSFWGEPEEGEGEGEGEGMVCPPGICVPAKTVSPAALYPLAAGGETLVVPDLDGRGAVTEHVCSHDRDLGVVSEPRCYVEAVVKMCTLAEAQVEVTALAQPRVSLWLFLTALVLPYHQCPASCPPALPRSIPMRAGSRLYFLSCSLRDSVPCPAADAGGGVAPRAVRARTCLD